MGRINFFNWRAVAWLSLLTVAFSGATSASECFEVTGEAEIVDNDVSYARQMAIRDAIEQGAMSREVSVGVQAETSNYELVKQTAQFSAQQKVVDFNILSEFKEGENIVIKARVCVTQEAKTCPNFVAKYHPRIAVANVAVQDEYSARDIVNPAAGYQAELLSRLWAMGKRNAIQYEAYPTIFSGAPIRPNMDIDLLQQVQDRTLAQFMVLTVIRSLDWQAKQSHLAKNVRQYFGYEKEPNERTVSVEWYLVDLYQKRIFAQGESFKQVFAESGVLGDDNIEVKVGRDKPFGSRQFWVTPTGQAFDFVLSEQAKAIYDHIACVPLEAEIAEVEKDKVIVPFPIDSGVQKGDVLAVYRKDSRRPYRFGSNIELGDSLAPAAFIRVEKVLPKFIVGKFEGKREKVQAGDLVKSW
jgi:hypothetical protein